MVCQPFGLQIGGFVQAALQDLVGIEDHRAKFVRPERAPTSANPGLAVEGAASGIQHDENGNE